MDNKGKGVEHVTTSTAFSIPVSIARTLVPEDSRHWMGKRLWNMKTSRLVTVRITFDSWKFAGDEKTKTVWTVTFGKGEASGVVATKKLHPENFKFIIDAATEMMSKHHEPIFEGQHQ